MIRRVDEPGPPTSLRDDQRRREARFHAGPLEPHPVKAPRGGAIGRLGITPRPCAIPSRSECYGDPQRDAVPSDLGRALRTLTYPWSPRMPTPEFP